MTINELAKLSIVCGYSKDAEIFICHEGKKHSVIYKPHKASVNRLILHMEKKDEKKDDNKELEKRVYNLEKAVSKLLAERDGFIPEELDDELTEIDTEQKWQ